LADAACCVLIHALSKCDREWALDLHHEAGVATTNVPRRCETARRQ